MDTLRFKLLKYKKVFVVYDTNVVDYATRLAGKYPMFPIVATEENKSIQTVTQVCRWLLDQQADRKSLVLAIGGGITTDIVGFAASIYKRGIRFAFVPTTLVGQIDAAIGGKNGVNLDGYKNMVGTFNKPDFIYWSPEPLKTLPQSELASGAAEMLKTFIIADPLVYHQAVRLFSTAQTAGALDTSVLPRLIKRAARIKKRIVRRDPLDKGRRRVLNLGHTYGHAIEWWQSTTPNVQTKYSHGQAVAIGIIQAARLSEQRGYARQGLADNLAFDFESCGLPVQLPCPQSLLEPALQNDKKARGGKIDFVFIRRIGAVTIKKYDLSESLE